MAFMSRALYVLFQVRADIEVKLLAGVQHVFFGAYHQHGRQADIGRVDGYHGFIQ